MTHTSDPCYEAFQTSLFKLLVLLAQLCVRMRAHWVEAASQFIITREPSGDKEVLLSFCFTEAWFARESTGLACQPSVIPETTWWKVGAHSLKLSSDLHMHQPQLINVKQHWRWWTPHLTHTGLHRGNVWVRRQWEVRYRAECPHTREPACSSEKRGQSRAEARESCGHSHSEARLSSQGPALPVLDLL